MGHNIFAFTLTTPTRFEKGDSIFDNKGEFIGRILYRISTLNEDCYIYHIESTIEDYEKIQKGEITLSHVEQYHVSPCNVRYTKEEF